MTTNPPKFKTIFIPPPIINTTYEYINVNKDPHLREDVTNYFYDKLQYKFKNSSSKSSTLKIIYYILKRYIKKYNLNWWDLRSNSSEVSDYILRIARKLKTIS